MGCGRSAALELLLEGLPGDEVFLSAEESAAVVEELADGPVRTDLAMRADGELVAIEPALAGDGVTDDTSALDSAIRKVDEIAPPSKKAKKG